MHNSYLLCAHNSVNEREADKGIEQIEHCKEKQCSYYIKIEVDNCHTLCVFACAY